MTGLEAAPGVEPGNRGFADLRLNHLATPPVPNTDTSEGRPVDQGQPGQLVLEDLEDLSPEEAWLEWQTLRALPPKRFPFKQSEINFEFYRNLAAISAVAGVVLCGIALLMGGRKLNDG